MTLESQFKSWFKNLLAERLEFLNVEFEIIDHRSGRRSIPDTIILVGKQWAVLDFKKSEDAAHRPNQDYYITRMNRMSYAAYVYPENAEEILDDLERLFSTA